MSGETRSERATGAARLLDYLRNEAENPYQRGTLVMRIRLSMSQEDFTCALDDLIERGLVEREDSRCTLTPAGWRWTDETGRPGPAADRLQAAAGPAGATGAGGEPVIHVENLHRVYHLSGEDIHAINDVTLSIFPGQITAIVGPSGAGKTTLLNLIAGLDEPTGGNVWFEGQCLNSLSAQARLRLRREKIGFIFQTFGLLPLLNAAENVGVPLRMRRLSAKEREVRIMQALQWVDLADRAHHRPYELSGGEQQRVAVARALAAYATVILADEPTGQLDSQTGSRIVETLRRLVTERGVTVIVATHDPQVIEAADVVYELLDGRMVNARAKDAPVRLGTGHTAQPGGS